MSSRLISIACILLLCVPAAGQGGTAEDFKEVCDSLSISASQRTGVSSTLQLKAVMKRGRFLDFYFTESLSTFPWRSTDTKWFRKELESLLPEEYGKFEVGEIYSGRTGFKELEVSGLHNDGKVHSSRFRRNDPRKEGTPIVRRDDASYYPKGLSGRHIALWQSHGRYFDSRSGEWRWQRSQIFTTVEDMYTQSYVLPFLIPMLENAGAYVMTPRERDTQINEAIVDNDPAFSEPREGRVRKSGEYSETGRWSDAGNGFADSKIVYSGTDNPFSMGSARKASCEKHVTATATWTPDIPERGRYAVYVSYKSLPESSTAARYTVRHMGGETRFSVNQKIGGGTWIYLGTFEFGQGKSGSVILDNRASKGQKTVVTADGVKIGGGMGKILRGRAEAPVETWTTSGMPAYMEGALYWMQWAGADSKILTRHPDDYTNDFADRGPWTSMMSGGSRVNPNQEGKGIPFDLSLAFHSDAGVTANDSIIGTLAIYTLMSENSRKLPNGEDRMVCREYSDMVQSQIVNDIRATYEPQWTRRQIWDRSYSESRTSSVPALLLELLSHQNFADMKYGLDPGFRFTVSRAVYKGILKFLSNRYGCNYAVQPLPVNSFSVRFAGENKAELRWRATADTLEKTAEPSGFILYRRTDDGVFDNGTTLKNTSLENGVYSVTVPIEAGRISSFMLEAFNDGGRSFPSEILSIGRPEAAVSDSRVLVVNNFYRISAPAWVDTPLYAGFDSRLDRGVPYRSDISYIGEQYQYRRFLPWLGDENPGFGATFSDEAGLKAAGNTFDYPYIHGKAIMKAGLAFCSAGSDAFMADTSLVAEHHLDLICGKQVTTAFGSGRAADRYRVFPLELQTALRRYAASGGNILVSGANIGTDIWDEVYPVRHDSTFTAASKEFARSVLGYRWVTNYAGRSGKVNILSTKDIYSPEFSSPLSWHTVPNEEVYCVETPDGIAPASSSAASFLRYEDTGTSAGVYFEGKGYKVVSIGFPLETIRDEEDMAKLIGISLKFFEKSADK